MAMLVITRGYIMIYRISHYIPFYIYIYIYIYPMISHYIYIYIYIYVYITYSNVSLAQMLPLIPQNAGSQHLQG